MRYVDNLGDAREDTHKKEVLFDRVGGVVINDKEKSFAKIVTTTRRDRQSDSYYVRVHKGVPYDPLGMHGHRDDYIEAKLDKVSKDTFDYYMMFLETKNLLYMTRAQRSFIND